MKSLLLLLVLLSACGAKEPPTAVLLRISAQGSALDAKTVRVWVLGGMPGGASGALVEQRVVDLPTKDGWPIEIAVEPKNGDASRKWRVEAWGLLDDKQLGTGIAEDGFTAGKIVEASLVLKPGANIGNLPQPGAAMADAGGDVVDGSAEIDAGAMGDTDGSVRTPPTPKRKSCLDVHENDGKTDDGSYLIDPDGSGPARAFDVFCVGMNAADPPPIEYLSLLHSIETQEVDSNFSRYQGGGPGPIADPIITNRYTKVRFILQDFVIDTADRRFATLEHDKGVTPNPPDGLPYGTAGNCNSNTFASGAANIDLRGTGFALAPSAAFEPLGYLPFGMVTKISTDWTEVTLTGGGYCGVFGPTFDGTTAWPGRSLLPIVQLP